MQSAAAATAEVHRLRLELQRIRLIELLSRVTYRSALRRLFARYDELLGGTRRDGWTHADAQEIADIRSLAQ